MEDEDRVDEEDRALEEEEEGVGEHFKDTELELLGGDREGTTCRSTKPRIPRLTQ